MYVSDIHLKLEPVVFKSNLFPLGFADEKIGLAFLEQQSYKYHQLTVQGS